MESLCGQRAFPGSFPSMHWLVAKRLPWLFSPFAPRFSIIFFFFLSHLSSCIRLVMVDSSGCTLIIERSQDKIYSFRGFIFLQSLLSERS